MSLWEVSNSVDFSVLESFVLARWQRDHTFARSLARRRDAPRYVFLDGPPFATGLPHYGHVLTSFVKDVVPRYQTMRGFHVPRRWGWDCHGLPVELEVEKELGLAAPTGADAATVAAFNAACRGLVARSGAENVVCPSVAATSCRSIWNSSRCTVRRSREPIRQSEPRRCQWRVLRTSRSRRGR